jgi:hypothetical protein
LPLWRSDDLVSWRAVGFAGGWRPLAQPSGGVWAPAIRQHDGRLFITWADPDRGVFVVDAPELEGPWSEPRLLIDGPGPIDPCPMWDSDGRTWLVHGWARSRAGFANRLDIVEVDDSLTARIGPSRILIDGDDVDGCTVLEGPKLYRHGEDYVLFAPAGGVETGWQYVFRAGSIFGPWEARIVLEQGGSDVNGPHQGAWVIGADGEEWFLHFQHTRQHGRILHLQPLAWGEDGWPRIGAATAGGPPEPVREWRRPTPRPRGGGASLPPSPISSRAWHGRGVDPRDLEADDAGTRLQAGQYLGLPLDATMTSVRVRLTAGRGAICVVGAEEHRLTLPARPDDVGVATPVTAGIEIADGRMRFTVDDDAIGEWFAPSPAQWTGVEIGVTAESGSAVFDLRPA